MCLASLALLQSAEARHRYHYRHHYPYHKHHDAPVPEIKQPATVEIIFPPLFVGGVAIEPQFFSTTSIAYWPFLLDLDILQLHPFKPWTDRIQLRIEP